MLRLPLRIAFYLLVQLPAIGVAYGHRWLERRAGGEFRPLSMVVYRIVGVMVLVAAVVVVASVLAMARRL
jgi:hypothetical protein